MGRRLQPSGPHSRGCASQVLEVATYLGDLLCHGGGGQRALEDRAQSIGWLAAPGSCSLGSGTAAAECCTAAKCRRPSLHTGTCQKPCFG